jgi:GNAT superfamily N-acetyltransferase
MAQEYVTRINRSGEPFELRISCAEDLPRLLEMYRTFSPRPATQGLPPKDPDACQDWVQTLFKIGVNVLAWKSASVIGHVALVPDMKGNSGELVIFVHQNYRNLWIGSELMQFTLEKFVQRGFESVWLTTNVKNFIAIKLYQKLGFKFRDMDPYERVMGIKLTATDGRNSL